jgi:hypothetical protein
MQQDRRATSSPPIDDMTSSTESITFLDVDIGCPYPTAENATTHNA